jgi:hypothetical protein
VAGMSHSMVPSASLRSSKASRSNLPIPVQE